jgi:ParB family chromosome partitioning protein
VQPIVVRPLDAGCFEIVAGERRWRAAQLAGLSSVPVVVRELDDHAAIAVALIENIQRETLNPLEEANALRTLFEHTTASTGTPPTQQALSALVGKSVSWVSKRLALLERPASVQQAVVSGALSVDAAARRPDAAGEAQSKPARPARKAGPRPAARVDAHILQSSVKRLNALADSLGLPGVDLPSRPARKDYVAAFEQRIVEILDAAHRSIKSE